jgi:hypothetical protein
MRVDLVDLRSAISPGSGRSSTASLLSEWRVGAILQAIAVRDARSGQLWLDIGGQRHPARVASGEGSGPAHGEQLQVRVLRTSPVLALETLPATSAASSTEATIVDALRRFVPRQESAALMLANLAWLAQGKNSADALPKTVMQAAAQLWQALPTPESLSDAQGLQKALSRSGAFLEANLATATRPSDAATIGSDLKALMLSLSRSLREHGARPADTAIHSPIPTARGPLSALSSAPATFALIENPEQQLNELSRQTEGALARLTTTQITNSAPDANMQSMLIELPVRQDDRAAMLRLRVERDQSRRRETGSDSWTVEAAVDLGQIGALHAKVTLAGHRIGVQLRAESAAIVDTLAARAGELESMLREAGLEIDRIVCLHGMPAGDAGARAARLLDVRA